MYMYPILHNQFKMKLELYLEKQSKLSKEKRGESFQVSVKVGEWQGVSQGDDNVFRLLRV